MSLVGCGAPSGVKAKDPGTLLEYGGTFVGFDANDPRHHGTVHVGDRTTVSLHDVSVMVQAPAGLRARIVRTIGTFRIDPNGCPATHRISRNPAVRPHPAIAVDTLTQVSRVAACKYGIAAGAKHPGPLLLSSIRLTGEGVQDAIERIASAPTGGGPDSTHTCARSLAYGEEVIVLRIESAQGRSEVILRYQGCDHNGFDDGHQVRRLSHATVAPFVTGANIVLEFSGLVKGAIFGPQ